MLSSVFWFLEEVEANEPLNFDLMMTVMLGLMYAYVAYTALTSWYRLRKEGMLFESKLLYPTNCEMSACIDEGGYVEFIQPKMLLMGISCAAFLVVDMGSVFLADYLPDWIEYVVQIAPPLVLVVYMVIIFRIAAKRFW